MATIPNGNTSEIYAAADSSITLTPGSGGVIEFDCSSPSGSGRPVARKIYASETISIPGGSTVFARAVGADAAYSLSSVSGALNEAQIDSITTNVVDSSGNVIVSAVYPQLPITVGSTQSVALLPGEHRSVTVTPGSYWVDADFDLLVVESAASLEFGAQLAGDADAYTTTAGSLAAQTGLDFGANSFTFEAWLQLNGTTPNDPRVLGFGEGTICRIDIYAGRTGAASMRPGIVVVGATNQTIVSDNFSAELGASYPLSTLYHMAIKVNRAAGGASGSVQYFLNGTQVRQASFTEAATPINFNLSANTSASARMSIGGTVGANAEWNGRIEDIKFYNTALSVSQIQARNAAGPTRSLGMDAADANLKWWTSFNDSTLWADATRPQTVSGYGNTVFGSLVGAPSITQRAGGVLASPGNAARIMARRPQKITVTQSSISVFADSATGGVLRLTGVV